MAGRSPKKEEEKDGPTKPKGENVMEDSCLWAHVEEMIRSCRRLDRASSEQVKLTKFEEYVMDLIKKNKVSSDIFWRKAAICSGGGSIRTSFLTSHHSSIT
ncbi:hypothetical protein NL676_023842 [Syzygium grande]|nr:hypothetical protein NL676_023842 [Syzygium grande]